ncbi:MAG: ribosome biogenesis GTPase Der [Chloroflexi bacterium]|nr:ribosome biogenesis GTPase Der [Chloroflexota bacterium]MYE40598.1 ribosome biogenesis GTPase Der [Chloroflexota bacterium]
MPLPIIAIVGRPNVGKSSLFNRIVGWRHAIVSDVAGTTRDRLMADTDWEGRRFILLDTGGLESAPEGEIRSRVQEQAEMAMNDADVIILMTDVADGITPSDTIAAQRLRTTEKPVILAVNKVDNDNREFNIPEFYELGMGDPTPVSAYHNYGIYELMERVLELVPGTVLDYEDSDSFEDEALEEYPESLEDVPPQAELNLSIVGRTNVGKSALLNAILGQERSIVSPIAGTTRDALDTQFSYRGREVVVVDTAGMRRPGQVERGIEKYSVIRAVGAVDRCDISLIVVDASELATAQDTHIAGLAWEMGRGVIVVVNKWDLREEQGRYARAEAEALVRERLHFMSYVPVCFTSALHSHGIGGLMDTAMDLWDERRRLVGSRDLQFMLADAMSEHSPPLVKRNRGVRARINRVRQVGINPPTFLFTVNDPRLIHYTYKRYLENRIRDAFGFDRTHLRLVFRRE